MKKMSLLKVWILASRPKTLGAAVAPVIIGTSIALFDGSADYLAAAAALFGAVMIQIGANFSNDYFDYLKGADTEERSGPVRATQAGLVKPAAMKMAFIIAFSLAAVSGIYLVYVGGVPILVLGIVSIVCGILYTGGPYPLGYHGLGDIFVFFFFGLAAVCGTYYVQAHSIDLVVAGAGIAPGLYSMGILAVNNLRDADTDSKTGKRTLAVIFGKRFVRMEYLISVVTPAVIPLLLYLSTGKHPFAIFSSFALFPSMPLIKTVFHESSGEELNRVLASTGKVLLLYSILFSVGWNL
jgi:1,4-dihydroxy-2-naphthoate octaprenyltransferase